jgi:hypothetical protein
MTFPQRAIGFSNFAPDGTIWFTDNNDWGLNRVGANGTP